MKISVVIPAKNEEAFLRKTLVSVKSQLEKGDEVIVVCDCCTDNSQTVAKRYTKKVFSVDCDNVSATRNFGAHKAQGDVLVFLDADSIMSEGLLSAIRSWISSGKVGGTCRTLSLEGHWKANVIWFFGNIGRLFFIAASGLLFCRKKAFDAVGGYDEKLTLAEDTYLVLGLKKKGRMKYLWKEYIRTSDRRMEKYGYFKTIYTQFKGFFIKGFNQY